MLSYAVKLRTFYESGESFLGYLSLCLHHKLVCVGCVTLCSLPHTFAQLSGSLYTISLIVFSSVTFRMLCLLYGLSLGCRDVGLSSPSKCYVSIGIGSARGVTPASSVVTVCLSFSVYYSFFLFSCVSPSLY